MTTSKGPNHVVVDGSNIATEGRSLPSLAQLSDAVMAFMEEHPDASITVVVDATFGHRIDKKESKEFEEGISNNELVAPPAGAVGRGDAFVLSIAQKANASILSNDSFQEFHGDYEWLFDEGRLIGGKPVPHVGWVFVDRLPVRGPVSRKATGSSRGGAKRGSKRDSDSDNPRSGRKASAAAMEPMPVPKSPPPGRRASQTSVDDSPPPQRDSNSGRRERTPNAGEVVNELMPFLEFVEHHPVGTSVNGTVESYSSHGAYISIAENSVRGYVPLRLMAKPAPTSARKVMQIGESVTLVVVSFAPLRRSIDCAMPDMADAAIAEARAEQVAEASAGRGSETVDTKQASSTKSTPARKAPATKAPAKKAAAKKVPAAKAPAAKAPAETAPAKKVAAKRAPATKAAAKKVPAKKAAAKAPATKAAAKAPATKVAANTPEKATKTPATMAAPSVVSAEKTPSTKVPTKTAPATKAVAKKSAANKGPAKNAPAKKTVANKVQAKRAPATTAPAKKAAANTASAKNAPRTKRSAKKAAPSDPGE